MSEEPERYWYVKDGNYEAIHDQDTAKTYYMLESVAEAMNNLHEENLQLKKENSSWRKTAYHFDTIGRKDREYSEQLYKENKRLTDKLNNTALELVDGVISMEKAVEISEMNYNEFLEYRMKNGKPMELQL